MKGVSGLDAHKDSVFLCILDETGVVHQSKHEVLTPDLEKMARQKVSEVGRSIQTGIDEKPKDKEDYPVNE